jgi:hypothetical protein
MARKPVSRKPTRKRSKKSHKRSFKRILDPPVLVPIPEFRPKPKSSIPSWKDVLLAKYPRFDIKLPKRGKLRLRKAVHFD